jgi:CpeT protein
MILKTHLVLSLITIFFSQKSFSQEPQIKAVSINALVNMMEGSFSNEEQLKNDTGYQDIRLHIKKIWPDNAEGKWLYAELSVADNPATPCLQRVYRITQKGKNNFESTGFTLIEQLRFAGEWKKENPLSELTPDSLTETEECSVFFKLINDTTFQGSTMDNDCSCEMDGAKFAALEVKVTKNEIIILEKRFAESGKPVQITGKDEYIFKRLDF